MARERIRRRKREAAAEIRELPPLGDLIAGAIAQFKMDDMDGDLWSGLPSEVEEIMLSFLSVPVLCRFRTVCKRWNSLICNPRFGALCIQNGRAQDFLVACCDDTGAIPCSKILGWRILDLNARRWYTIKHDKIDMVKLFNTRILAMDGGLVYAYYLDLSTRDPFSAIVSNPIAKGFRRLPPSPYYPKNPTRSGVPPKMNMVVNNITQEFQIFVIPCVFVQVYSVYQAGFQAPQFRLDIYESTTNQWRSSTNLPKVPGDYFRVWCTVIFEGILYALISPLASFEENWQLWSYNAVEDAWKNTGAKSDTHVVLVHPQLIVANNRLYLVSWVTPWDYEMSTYGSFITPTFDIIEISLVEGACKKMSTFCQRTQLEMRREFKVSMRIGRLVFESNRHPGSFVGCPDIRGYGFDRSIILIARRSGISVEIDLRTCEWELLPLEPLPCDQGLWYVKPMNLILPSALWWQGEKREAANCSEAS